MRRRPARRSVDRATSRFRRHHRATIIVGVDDSPRAQDAIALAGDLARATGAEVLAVCAFPFDDQPRGALQLRHARHRCRTPPRRSLGRLCEPLSDLPHVRRPAVADPSPARALLDAAAAADARR